MATCQQTDLHHAGTLCFRSNAIQPIVIGMLGHLKKACHRVGHNEPKPDSYRYYQKRCLATGCKSTALKADTTSNYKDVSVEIILFIGKFTGWLCEFYFPTGP